MDMIMDIVKEPSALAFWLGLLVVVLVAVWLAVPKSARAQIREMPESRAEVQLSYAPVVRSVAPAVVNVYSRRVVREFTSPFANDPLFERFFGLGFRGPQERQSQSLGSGVIVSSDGIIVTNNHVIAGGEEITVALADRREYDAVVILADERTDIAVLRIDPGNEELPVVRFHNSDELQVGDLVLALGNPFGVGQTVTSGIVSALARTQVGVSDYQFFIQTDAAINPGNSGGALVTLDGGLVGINTAIFSRSGGSIGIGFAIPANMVRLVVESAIEGTPIVRPWIGVSTQPVTSDLAEGLNLDRPAGALINQIFDDGPAARGGLQIGDVILKFAGFDIVDPSGLRYRIGTQRPGSSVEIEFLREGRTRTVELELAEPPEDPPRSITQMAGRNPFEGATVANLSPAFNEENGIDSMLAGVVIIGMQRGTTAWRLRLQAGDIVREVNGTPITYVEDLERATSRQQGRWDVTYERQGQTFSFSVRG